MKLVEQPRGRVVLYYPKLWEPQWPMWAPMDLFAIATAIMQAGYEVTFIDERIDPEPRYWLEKALPGALFAGITGKFGDQIRNTVAAAEFIKAKRPDLPVVAGGWLPSLFPEATLELPAIDVVVQGPGDFNTPEICNRLLAGRELEGIPGVWFKGEGGAIRSTPFEHLPPIKDTPQIPWDVVNLARYRHPHGWINYYSSRGCPGGCGFCAIYCLDPGRWTGLPAERIVNDWEVQQRDFGMECFKVLDTDFCADIRRVETICRLVLERGLEIRFEVLGRHAQMSRMSDEQIRLLRRAGCTEIEMGVESGAQRLVDLIDKRLTVEDVPGTVRRFVDAGIRIKVNIMFGVPTETREDLKTTLDFLNHMRGFGKGVRLQLFRYTPLPDAPMNRQVWRMKTRGHDGREPRTLQELMDLPINDQDTRMFWISRKHERDVKRLFHFYAPFAYFPNALDSARDRPVWRRVLAGLRPLARWRVRRGCFRFPVEMWLNRVFGRPMPRGEDDGIGPPEDVLENPYMGDGISGLPPLTPGCD